MKEVYRIKKGKLTIQNQVIPFDFGLVFEEEGIYFFDFYVSESFDLKAFMDNEGEKFRRNYFTMSALTDKNNEIEATQLSIINITPDQSFMKMQSCGYLKHIEVRENFGDEKEKEEKDKRQTLFYLEIEGLKMEYVDLTETTRARGGAKINDFYDWERDYTRALLVYDSLINFDSNNFLFTFFQSENENNITIELPNCQDGESNVLHYDTYKEFKLDLTRLLSLLNGAEVAIRKEFTGGFYEIGKVNSQEVITYSFKTIKNESYNRYVPLNNGFHRGDNILNYVFIHCFNKYVVENKKLDLNSIIFYLNGAEQTGSIQEKFFIQIIAFERLAQKFVETLNDDDVFILPDDDYQPIKKELFAVLKKHRSKKNKNGIGDLKAKVGELHKIKFKSTEYKFLKLLERADIPLTPEIKKIIDKVRHKAVHHGEIGKGNEGVKNYLVLDELLRDIILNIIGYDRARITRYRFEPRI